MKQVIINKCSSETIELNDVKEGTPIFVKLEGELIGMVVKENDGWIVRVGGDCGAYGYRATRQDLLEDGSHNIDYTFHVED